MTLPCSLADGFRRIRGFARRATAVSLATALGGCTGAGGAPLEDFSFFVTSMAAMLDLSGRADGFGGDLSYNGKAGVLGADEICTAVAERSMPGAGVKGWRAFLSTSTENAVDRIGGGPWFDRRGRKIADDKAALTHERPRGADAAIAQDLPNEEGVPNHLDGDSACASDNSCHDNHDVLTGSNEVGELDPTSTTCADWTSTTEPGEPRIGHSWPAQSGRSWISAHRAGGCGRGIKIQGGGRPQPGDRSVGAGGGYGAIYCFASTR